jgi:hypothetical protein
MATGNKAWISGHLFPSSGYIIWLTIPLQRGKDSGWGGAVEAFWPVHCGLTARVKDEMTLQLNRESSYIVGTWNFKLFFFSLLSLLLFVRGSLASEKNSPPLPFSNCSTLSLIILSIEFCFLFSRDSEIYTREKLEWNRGLWSSSESHKNVVPFSFPISGITKEKCCVVA